MMNGEERFIPKRQRHRPMVLPQHFSEEEMVEDWTLSEDDIEEIGKYRKSSRLYIALQLCAMRLYGRFLNEVHDVSPRILNYFNVQLGLPPSLALQVSGRIATLKEHRKNIESFVSARKGQLIRYLIQLVHCLIGLKIRRSLFTAKQTTCLFPELDTE